MIYLGSFYLFTGIIFLLIPIIYIELGRPKDLIKAGVNLISGMFLIVKHNFFNTINFNFLLLLTILIFFYLVEIFSIRWNQLTNREKNKLKTLVELKNNLAKFSEAISLLAKDFLKFIKNFKFDKINENLIKKKWVRNEDNDNILTSKEKH